MSIETRNTPLAQTSYWAEPVTMAELIATALDWSTRNPGAASARLDAMERELPRGSGIDAGTKIDRSEVEPPTGGSFSFDVMFRLSSSWHAMDSNGYYAGWSDFAVIVRSTFAGPTVELEWADDKSPAEDYPGDTTECGTCSGTGHTGAHDTDDCEVCEGTGEVSDPDSEWFGISDPSDYLIDVYSDAVRRAYARIEFDTPPE